MKISIYGYNMNIGKCIESTLIIEKLEKSWKIAGGAVVRSNFQKIGNFFLSMNNFGNTPSQTNLSTAMKS